MKLKILTSIILLLFIKILNSQTTDIPITVFIDHNKIKNNDSLLNISLIPKKDYSILYIKYNNQKVRGYLYEDELFNTDSIHFFIATKNRYKKANIHYMFQDIYVGFYRAEDCRYYSHDIVLYVKKDMERKKRNIFVDKFILTKCKFQIYIQEIKSKKMF